MFITGQDPRPSTGGAPWFTTNRRRPWHVRRVIDSETRDEGDDPVDEGTFASYRRPRELLG